ncbi:unnamed protein product [Prunus armeniaca]
MAKLKHLISCKALTKLPNNQKPPPFTGGFVPNKPTQNKVYSFNLTKVDTLFDEILLQKAIETPHRLPKPEELKGKQMNSRKVKAGGETSISYNRSLSPASSQHGQLKLARTKEKQPATEASSNKGRRVTREASQRPKATISAGVVLCSNCKCESELEVILDRQNQPTPSVFDRIGTLYQQGPIPALSKDRTRQKDYLRPAQRSRRMTEQPKKEIPIKMSENEKPLTTIIEGR